MSPEHSPLIDSLLPPATDSNLPRRGCAAREEGGRRRVGILFRQRNQQQRTVVLLHQRRGYVGTLEASDDGVRVR